MRCHLNSLSNSFPSASRAGKTVRQNHGTGERPPTSSARKVSRTASWTKKAGRYMSKVDRVGQEEERVGGEGGGRKGCEGRGRKGKGGKYLLWSIKHACIITMLEG